MTGSNNPPASARGCLPASCTFFRAGMLAAVALASLLSQGCRAAGVALLGMAVSTATKTGVSYTMDSRAQKTFTAPVGLVKAGLLVALQELEFPIASQEAGGEAVVAARPLREGGPSAASPGFLLGSSSRLRLWDPSVAISKREQFGLLPARDFPDRAGAAPGLRAGAGLQEPAGLGGPRREAAPGPPPGARAG